MALHCPALVLLDKREELLNAAVFNTKCNQTNNETCQQVMAFVYCVPIYLLWWHVDVHR